MTRVNNFTNLKLASARKAKPDPVTLAETLDRRNLAKCCAKLALAISRTGKLHGPTNIVEMFDYIESNSVRYKPREEARLRGDRLYISLAPCKICEGRLRKTNDATCYACSSEAKREQRDIKFDALLEAEIERVCGEYNCTREQVFGAERLPSHAKARHELWKFLYLRGMNALQISKRFNRHHKTVRHILEKQGVYRKIMIAA